MAVTVLTMTPGAWAESHVTDGVLGLPEIGVALLWEHLYRGMGLG